MKGYLDALVNYALDRALIQEGDELWAYNRLLEVMGLDEAEGEAVEAELPQILQALTDDAVRRGLIEDNITARDLFDTKLMGAILPPPHEVRAIFEGLRADYPEAATDWYYTFSCDSNYIRRDRIQKDLKWVAPCEYGDLDITVNLSKPEKDPRAIAAAKLAPQSGYPKCQLCAENEGYAGRMNHPARQNHRIIPLTINGAPWYFQYSPYVYYNEHCIVFNAQHTPMKIDKAAFLKLLDFVTQFPHYFVGSNADLPIVGGSILSHDHFQGGRYEFAMAKAPVETSVRFRGFEDVRAGLVKWPMSVIRLAGPDRFRLAELADKILLCWRGYTDEAAMILAETEGVPHNTITPIARRRGEDYELDLVLRNNLTTEEYPLGLYHPHQDLHHIKKENIGLIEVMGLAVLPSRLKGELTELRRAILAGEDLRLNPLTASHADWAEELKTRYTFTEENTEEILRQWNAADEKNLDTFQVLYDDHTDDYYYLNGLVECYYKHLYTPEMDTWVYDSARKEGDAAVFVTPDDQIAYFVRFDQLGENYCDYLGRDGLSTADFLAWNASIKEGLTAEKGTLFSLR